jgi:hypothetical protein
VYQNPAHAEALVRDRVAELRRSATKPSPVSPRERRRRGVTEAVRSGAGWLLVEMGLRLAVPRSAMDSSVARRPSRSA